MTWYLYKKPDSLPDLVDYPLALELFPGYKLMSVHEDCPDIHAKIFDIQGELIPNRLEPLYVEQRRHAYPKIGNQLDEIWKWIGEHEGLFVVPPMLADILAVKKQFPKE